MNLSRLLNQTAVLWTQGAAGGDGNRTYNAGAEVTVRWQNRREQFTDASGKTNVSRAIVYFDGSAATITLGDRLFLGLLTDLTVAERADPTIVNLSYEVKANDLSPSVDASQQLRKAIL